MDSTANRIICCIGQWDVRPYHYSTTWQLTLEAHSMVCIQDVRSRLDSSGWCMWHPQSKYTHFKSGTRPLTICWDSNRIQQYFSSEKQPTLWRTLPALEELQTAWEEKQDSPRYALYKDALNDGLTKIGKYYSHLDQKPSFVLALSKAFILSSSYLRLLTMKISKFSICTTSLPTSNLHGGVLRSKLQRSQEGMLLQRTGKMRRGRSLRER